jgi:hypothetical protein
LREQRAARLAVDRHKFRQCVWRDDNAAGMRTCVASEAFQRPRKINQSTNLLLGLVETPEFFVIGERFFERDADFERNELRDSVDVAIRQPEYPANVSDNRFGGHRTERDDLRNAISTVTLGDIFDDAITPLDTEVDVEVRH